MNALRLLLASSTTALLAACTTPVAPLPKATPPEEIPGPSYTATTTATWVPTTGRTFQSIAAASAGDEGAVAYTESEDPTEDGVVRSHILLQLLDATGARSGPPIDLAIVELNDWARPSLALASDGKRYLACWQREASIACAGMAVGGGPVFAALSVEGSGPALAYGAGTFALAYARQEQVAVVRVASDGSAAGSPASFDTGAGSLPRAFLAASESGFALVSGDLGSLGNTLVQRLDGDLAPAGDPIDLGVPFWFRGAVAAYGTNVAIGLPVPYGGKVATLDGDTVTHVHAFTAGGKLGMNVGLLAGAGSFDMLSTYDVAKPGLRYRTLQGGEVITAEQALMTEHDFDGSALALLRLHGDLFLAATGGVPSEEIMVARVHRP